MSQTTWIFCNFFELISDNGKYDGFCYFECPYNLSEISEKSFHFGSFVQDIVEKSQPESDLNCDWYNILQIFSDVLEVTNALSRAIFLLHSYLILWLVNLWNLFWVMLKLSTMELIIWGGLTLVVVWWVMCMFRVVIFVGKMFSVLNLIGFWMDLCIISWIEIAWRSCEGIASVRSKF